MSEIRLTLSVEGNFLGVMSVSRLKSKRRDFVLLPHRDVFGAVSRRRFYACTIAGVAYHADVVTGTLYDAETGRCQTSDRMRIVREATVAPMRKTARKSREGTAWQRTEKVAA